jgi:DNA-binding MarR family transcriptional regulator
MATIKPVSEKSLTVLNYLKSIGDANVTAADIAEALGLEKKTVDGVITAGLIRNKNLVERVEAEMELADGTHKAIKLVKLTDAGKNYDHAAVTAAYEAEQAAAKSAE